MSTENDIFIINKIYPDAKDIFNVSVEPISNLKEDCLFVLDTNALLIPFTISPSSIEELKKVYTQIIDDNRLFIPAQVAREFANNRPERIKEIFSQFEKKKGNVHQLKIEKYPLLNGMSEYEDLINFQKELNEKLREYTTKVNAVIGKIKSWNWDDPVSQIYHELFKKEIIIEHGLSEEEIIKNLNFRYQYKIPPGYKDKRKKDDGIGDLLIWITILELAEKEKKSIVFVSGDEKTDWFHRSEGQPLYPRFELISEFRTKAPDKTFNIIKLSELLELYGADEKIVEEIESEESIINQNHFFSAYEVNYVNYIQDWIGKNIIGFNISIHESGFPEIVLVDNNNESKPIAAEIIIWREISPFLMSLKFFLEKFSPITLTSGYRKLIVFVVVKPILIVPTVIDEIKNLKQNFEIDELEIEIILGRVINDDFTVIQVI